MSSKYKEAFDSLGADDDAKRERTERILSAQSLAAESEAKRENARTESRSRRRFFAGKRGVAFITAFAVLVVAAAVAVPVGLSMRESELMKAMNLLKDTFVDMDGIEAFGLWNGSGSSSKTERLSSVARVGMTSLRNGNSTTQGKEATDSPIGSDDVITGEWSDEERYEWETDYDWDPTKAGLLVSIGENGKISEVVYERTNGRGQVRQDVLGNAAMVYVSDSFTYVMYVDDREWGWWQRGNYAQEMCYPSGFHCHHENAQTVVIHNETGKVYALKDVIPQVNELSGATNHTMQVNPYKHDYISICPMYGNGIPQWYNVVYDEQAEKIRYELMLPVDAAKNRGYDLLYFVRSARVDKYGQKYLLENYNAEEFPRVTAGIVELPSYARYENSVVFNKINGMLYGSDRRVYAFDGGKLKVFGEDFRLEAVEAGTEVTFEGIANEFFYYGQGNNEGIVYRLSDGYLYSMFGEVWKVDGDGTLHERGRLDGRFPRYADDGWMMGGEIIAFVDTEQVEKYSINGKIVHIRFESTNGTPKAIVSHIIDASELSVQPNNRTVVEQNERPLTSERGNTEYFLISVKNGEPKVNHFASGYSGSGGGIRLTKPITEPLLVSEE